MNGSTLLRTGASVIGLGAAPLALAQMPPPALMPPQWGFVGMMAGFGMLMVLGILALGVFNESRKNREKLALVERLVTSGQPVPRELMVNEPRQLTLLEQRRHDIRRGIAFLCWGIGIGVVFYIVSGGNARAAAWGLLFIVPGLGNFLKAWLTARDIARGSAGDPR
jgi:hypothetical protein